MALHRSSILWGITGYIFSGLILTCNLIVVHSLCGYESCQKTKPGFINVHLVPHSHDDVGWLKTVDQYYYGTRLDIGPEAVQYVLDSVVVELSKDPQRKFIYVESGFFWRWWRQQTEKTKDLVKRFVQNGQLEFISGGWSMNDEGSTHYSAIIDQMSLGLRFLNDTFGECAVPKVGWQIDSFGHSREQANIFANMGFDGLFLGRVDFKDKWNRLDNEEMEMLWLTSPNNLGKSASLFTGILYNYYQPPPGFCYDMLCKDDPINDDPNLDGYNVDTVVEKFIRVANRWARPYNTNHTLMTMGSDFHYMNGNMWYKNLDKLIRYVNNFDYENSTYGLNEKVNVFYSTPSCYLREVHKSGKALPIKTSDFFPYSNDYYGFWSGYFTSRPTFKYYIQKGNNFLQVCKQLAIGAFNGNPPKTITTGVWNLSEPLAIVQHHDAITGTAKQHVTDDYSKRIALGMGSCEKVVDASFQNLLSRRLSDSNNPASNQTAGKSAYRFCPLLNISACTPPEEMNEFLLSVYNPLARDLQDEYIRVPVPTSFWKVRSHKGFSLPQVVPIPAPVGNLPGRKSNAKYELVFKADVLPALTLTNFKISRADNDTFPHNATVSGTDTENSLPPTMEDIKIGNSKGTTITLDPLTGRLKFISKGLVQLPVEQNFFYYLGMAGNNSRFEDRASGAYIFRPNTSEENGHQPIPITDRVESYKIIRGKLVTEIHQIFNGWISQVIRLYETSDLVEFEWLVGPIPIEDGYGKEIVSRYSTNLKTKGNFFTDSNSRQLVKRQRDKRDYPFDKWEPVAQNYYPVTSRIIISEEDEDLPLSKGPTLTVLNDRSQGGTSMNDGEVELLIHRRLLYDDAFGVEEALNETAFGKGLVARGKHWLLLAGNGTGVPVSMHRELAQNIFMEKIMGFADANLFNHMSAPDHQANLTFSSNLLPRKTAVAALKKVLPSNVHLLTLEPLSLNQVLLRLEHFYERGEDAVNSQRVQISLEAIKNALPFVKAMRKVSLGGNIWADDMNRFEWKVKNPTQINNYASGNSQNDASEISLEPMEIVSLILSV